MGMLISVKTCRRRTKIEAISVGGLFALDHHLHLLVRLDPALGQGWSNEDIVLRWGRLFPPLDKVCQALPVIKDWVQARLKEPGWVARARQRLKSLSRFMKCLEEPLARLASRQDQTRGAFFEGRYFAVTRQRLRAVAKQCVVHHLANLGGCHAGRAEPG